MLLIASILLNISVPKDQSRTFNRSRYCRRTITLIAVTIEDVIILPVFRLQKLSSSRNVQVIK